MQRFSVPARLIAETRAALYEAGREGFELFALWSGITSPLEAEILTVHVPEQTSYKTQRGLVVEVKGEALHKLNVWLYEHEQRLLVQVHAHPTDAFHSDTDETYPMVTALGGLSVVVPDFAKDGVFVKGTKIYRLLSPGWKEVPRRRARRLIEVVD